MSAYDWSKFDVYMFMRCPAAAVFRAWATAAGLSSFFVQDARYIDGSGRARAPAEPARAGDIYRWEFSHGRRLEGRVLGVEEDRSFTFSFEDAEVLVRMIGHEGGTLAHLQQSKMPVTPEAMVAEHLNCRGGWIYRLTLLRVLLEFGIDARDVNPSTAASVSVYYTPP